MNLCMGVCWVGGGGCRYMFSFSAINSIVTLYGHVSGTCTLVDNTGGPRWGNMTYVMCSVGL